MVYRFCLLAVALGITLTGDAVSAAPPTGFADSLVASVASPTALAFTPDGRLLVISQTGQLRVVSPGAAPQLALDLGPGGSDVLCSTSERGLLGVAVDPQFATNHFIYLYYTFKKHPTAADPCPIHVPSSPDNPVNRVSRFVLPGGNLVDPSSETIMIDNIPSPRGNHNAGDLQFGKDGYLYISIGDERSVFSACGASAAAVWAGSGSGCTG